MAPREMLEITLKTVLIYAKNENKTAFKKFRKQTVHTEKNKCDSKSSVHN